MYEFEGSLKIRFLEKIMRDADYIGRRSIAEEFGKYLTEGSYVSTTPALLLSLDFSIKNLGLYGKLPGSFHGNMSSPNFIADRSWVKRLESVVAEYRVRFSA